MMSFTAAGPSGNLTVDQLELARIGYELVSIGKRHGGLLSAIRALTQRETSLASALDLELQQDGKTVRPAGDIAIEIGQVRLGIAELERLRREAERKKAELESLNTHLSLALSLSQSRDSSKFHNTKPSTSSKLAALSAAEQPVN